MTYLRNAWYVAGWSHEIVAARPLGKIVLGEPIVIWKDQSGRLSALEDRCVHRSAPLSMGRCEGDAIRCMYHGLLYDTAGRVIEIPGQENVPSIARVKSYPVVARHGWLWVWMGHKESADTQLIPEVVGLDHPNYLSGHNHLDYAAEANLVNNNLLDLGHASFLHLKTFNVSETWVKARPRVVEHARGVAIDWWIRNEPFMGMNADLPLVDTYLTYQFSVPGIMQMSTRQYPAGTSENLQGGTPDLSVPEVSVTSQAITPLSETTTRYYYTMGMPRTGDETSFDMTLTNDAFLEDRAIIEGQQHMMTLTGNRKVMPTTADFGIQMFSRVVEKLKALESSSNETS